MLMLFLFSFAMSSLPAKIFANKKHNRFTSLLYFFVIQTDKLFWEIHIYWAVCFSSLVHIAQDSFHFAKYIYCEIAF